MLFLISNKINVIPSEKSIEIIQPYFHVHFYENENINFDHIDKVVMCWKESLLYIVGSLLSIISIYYIINDLRNLEKN